MPKPMYIIMRGNRIEGGVFSSTTLAARWALRMGLIENLNSERGICQLRPGYHLQPVKIGK